MKMNLFRHLTLSRQLFAVISLLLLAVLGRMFWISVDNTRAYLDDQMRTQTSNAVDSLGISLQPALLAHDMAMTETLVNAAFDHGYYRQLLLEDMQGKALFKRVNSDPVKDVPQWFIGLLPLDAPEASATLTSGWMQFGRLSIQAHPGRAYVNLWTSFRQLLMLALWTFIASIVAVLLLVRGMLKPLRAIEAQALAISQREFPINNIVPWTREFRHVVQAMNRMSEKVGEIIHSLTDHADELQRQARMDSLTGLPNRSGFMPALAAMLGSYESNSSGLFVLIKLDDFADFNDRVGYRVADKLLQTIAGILSEHIGTHRDALVGRIGGVDFALVLPNMHSDDINRLCTSLRKRLDAVQGIGNSVCHIFFGATCYSADNTMSEILGRADTALTGARGNGLGFSVENDNKHEHGLINWQEMVDDVLLHRRINLLGQPIQSCDNQTLYFEVLARIRDDQGEYISPATFMPMAERLGRMLDVDACVLKLAIRWLSMHEQQQLAVNLSSSSLQHAAASSWLAEQLGQNHAACKRLLIEISEHSAMLDGEMTSAFIDNAHESGVRVVMERFGSGLASFHTLRRLKLDFIKLDGSYVRGLANDAENRFFLHNLLDIAHGLDIRVIAEQVEDDADREALEKMGIDALQGWHIGKPEPLE